MPRTRLVYLVVAIVGLLLITSATFLILWPNISSSTGKDTYGYITRNEFVLMHGSHEVVRVPRRFSDFDTRENKIVWTHSGRYIAFFTEGLKETAAPERELYVVNTNSGEVKVIKCPGCTDITPVGDDDVLAMLWPDVSKFTRFHFATGMSSGLELAFYFDVDDFIGSSQNYIATRKTHRSPRHEQGFELTPLDGSGGQSIGNYPSANSYIFGAVTEAAGKDRPTFAFATRHIPGGCQATFSVHVTQLKGDTFETDITAITPVGTTLGEDSGFIIQDLWWGRDGKLRASVTAWTCSVKGAPTATKMPAGSTVWKLERQKWTIDTAAPTGLAREVGSKNYISLNFPNCRPSEANEDACDMGLLGYHNNGAMIQIAEDVLEISSPTIFR
ncbi:hypothetical protein [Allorhizocola rhizosphaerae]|uniref:hypothetical protein n=1 Tax=Allorhizocola rhizosphaerae TaxID=1872709 RepID=UPI0013C370A8|nr:hypothetical protein [Allorhizocola rhizosphaerae]